MNTKIRKAMDVLLWALAVVLVLGAVWYFWLKERPVYYSFAGYVSPRAVRNAMLPPCRLENEEVAAAKIKAGLPGYLKAKQVAANPEGYKPGFNAFSPNLPAIRLSQYVFTYRRIFPGIWLVLSCTYIQGDSDPYYDLPSFPTVPDFQFLDPGLMDKIKGTPIP